MRRAPLVLALVLVAGCSSHSSGTSSLSTPATTVSSVSSSASSSGTPAPATAPPATAGTRRTGAASAQPTSSRSHVPVPVTTRPPSPTPGHTGPAATPTASRSAATYAVAEKQVDTFAPTSLTLRVGDRVRVTNADTTGTAHTFTIKALGADSGNMAQGAVFSYTFRRAGTFQFVCTYHQAVGMTGTVTVHA